MRHAKKHHCEPLQGGKKDKKRKTGGDRFNKDF